MGRDDSVGIATLQTGPSADRIPVQARFSAPVQTGPGAHPASSTTGTVSFMEVKRGIRHLSASSAEVKENVELYIYSLLGLHVCPRVTFNYVIPIHKGSNSSIDGAHIQVCKRNRI